MKGDYYLVPTAALFESGQRYARDGYPTMANLEDAIIIGGQDEGALMGEPAHDLQNAVNLGILYVCPINDGTCPNGSHKGGPFLHFAPGKTQNDYDQIIWPVRDVDSH